MATVTVKQLQQHVDWLRDGSGKRIEVVGANLRSAIGNMPEIKSAQFDQWAVTWSADLRWIAAMDSGATDWWSRYGALVLQLIDASPATGVVLEVQP
jgi:hypothetical protein